MMKVLPGGGSIVVDAIKMVLGSRTGLSFEIRRGKGAREDISLLVLGAREIGEDQLESGEEEKPLRMAVVQTLGRLSILTMRTLHIYSDWVNDTYQYIMLLLQGPFDGK